ncbi:MAG: hypothetical protein WCG01_00195 [bacterium]
MKQQTLKLILVLVAFLVLPNFASAAIDGAVNGMVYGDQDGIARIESIESELHNLTIKSSHPRIFLTPELISIGRNRIMAGSSAWADIQARIIAGDLVSTAFGYQMLAVSDSAQANIYANSVYSLIMAASAVTWTSAQDGATTGLNQTVANWALAYDWVYDGLTSQQRIDLIEKIKISSNIVAHADWIRAGNMPANYPAATPPYSETFHREEWIYYSWKAWPELALSGDVPDADYAYKERWKYNWVWGDAARLWAYINDGTGMEGYAVSTEGMGWFNDLKSATGINLIDGPDVSYVKNNAKYLFYNIDFGLNRMIFHNGSLLNGGGNWQFSDPVVGDGTNWKIRTYFSESLPVAMTLDAGNMFAPYYKYVLDNQAQATSSWNGGRTPSHWIINMNGYSDPDNSTSNIAHLLFYDNALVAQNPRSSSLPVSAYFPATREMNMRSSWSDDAARAVFKSPPEFTKTSHGNYAINTFMLYRKGNLSPETGIYDAGAGPQFNSASYKIGTVAHNNLLVVDPANPLWPYGLYPNLNSGGVRSVSNKTLSAPTPNTNGSVSNGSTFLLKQASNWSSNLANEINNNFTYAVNDGCMAYGCGVVDLTSGSWSQNDNRLNEYTRSFIFVPRQNDKAYSIIFDKTNSTNASYSKKWIIHTVTEPVFSDGNITNTEIAGKIETNNGNNWSASNLQGNSAMYGKILLPENHKTRKVGGGVQSIVTMNNNVYIARQDNFSTALNGPSGNLNNNDKWFYRGAYTEWSLGAAYNNIYRSIVNHNGLLYSALANHTAAANNEPGIGANWHTYWVMIGVNDQWNVGVQYSTDFAFWMDDGTTVTDNAGLFGKSFPIDWAYWKATGEANTGGPMEEIGKYRLEIMPTSQQQRDFFLNVIYMGNTGESVADSSLINTSDSTRIGVLIQDQNKNEVVVLNKNKFGSITADNFSYDAAISTADTHHLITEIEPNVEFLVKKNGSIIASLNSSSNGVLSFESTGVGLANFEIVKNSVSDLIAPSAPSGLSVL